MAVAKGAIEKSMGGATTRDTIRMKLQMDSDLGAVEGELKALGSIAAADDGKGKLGAAELTARKEILETLKTEYYKVSQAGMQSHAQLTRCCCSSHLSAPTCFSPPALPNVRCQMCADHLLTRCRCTSGSPGTSTAGTSPSSRAAWACPRCPRTPS